MSSGPSSWPSPPPAARVMLSFINVPPRSLHPASRQAAALSRPIFTQDTCTLRTWGRSASRPTACMSTASRKVGRLRGLPFR